MTLTARMLMTGVDAEGGSCVARVDDISFVPPPGLDGFRSAELYAAPSSPAIDTMDGRVGAKYDLGVAPGALRWMIVEYGPQVEFGAHHTDSVDFDLVLSGNIDLILGDGVHALQPGDCVLVTGVDHAWRAGLDGCRLAVLAIGAAPPN
jgi:quercetin dioxygenase-like cupin family protein